MGGKARPRVGGMDASLRLLHTLDALAGRESSRGRLDEVFDELVQRYLVLRPIERERLRRAYLDCEHWGRHDFWMNHDSYELRFRARAEAADLKRALAHLSLSDGAPDTRDALLSVSDLLAHAQSQDIEWQPLFACMAAVSSDEDHGVGSMRSHLLRIAHPSS